MDHCLFCKISAREIPAKVIYEDDKYIAFLDINPMHPGHSLLVMKTHIDYIFDIEDEELANFFITAKKVSKILKNALGTEKVGMVVEGYLVRHAHIHLIPINPGDALDPHLQKPMPEEELNKILEKIKLSKK